MNWLRLYTNALDHPKIQKLPPELFKLWVNLLCLARLHDGHIPSVADVAFRVRQPEEVVSDWLEQLIERRLLDETPKGLRPHDWDEHQYPSDSSTERSRRSRQRSRNVPATLQQRPRIEQSRVDKSKPDLQAAASLSPTPTQTPSPDGKTLASRLLVQFPGAEGLPGEPDDIILGKCLFLAGNDPEGLAVALRRIYLAGKKPSTSWAWFPVVLEQYLQPKRTIQRERRA